MDVDAWREQILEHRRRKDAFFADDENSPILPEERSSFDGLSYYPVDPAYQVAAKLDPDETGTTEVPRTQGEPVTYEKAGHLEIPLQDTTVRLLAFEQDDQGAHDHDHRHLFVPFRDATSGEQTYGTGRYLEVHEMDDGRFLVDFNQAYHPSCAYDPRYACPLPPPENTLEVTMEAGERLGPEA